MVTAPGELAAARAHLRRRAWPSSRAEGIAAPPCRRSASWSRCRRPRVAIDLFRRRLLLDRHQRPDPVRDGGLRATATARVAALDRSAASGRAAADRAGSVAHGAGHGARGQPVRRHGRAIPRYLPALLDCGLRALSVAPPALGRVKRGHRAPCVRRDGRGADAPPAPRPSPATRPLLQRVHRPPPVGHAPAARRGARQEPQLRLADHQPGLSPRRSRPAHLPTHLRDLPLLARTSARRSSTPTAAPIPSALGRRRRAAAAQRTITRRAARPRRRRANAASSTR